jgi:hypothetical protein
VTAKCTICSSDEREQIDQQLLAGVPLRQIASRFNRSKDAVRRHRVAHVSAHLAAVVAEQRARVGPATALDRVEELIERVTCVLDAAEQDGQAKLILDAAREIRALVELLARINGELREAPQLVVLEATPEWQRFRDALLSIAADYPEVEARVIPELEAVADAVDGGDAA